MQVFYAVERGLEAGDRECIGDGKIGKADYKLPMAGGQNCPGQTFVLDVDGIAVSGRVGVVTDAIHEDFAVFVIAFVKLGHILVHHLKAYAESLGEAGYSFLKTV